jgi:hypothetical protein
VERALLPAAFDVGVGVALWLVLVYFAVAVALDLPVTLPLFFLTALSGNEDPVCRQQLP